MYPQWNFLIRHQFTLHTNINHTHELCYIATNAIGIALLITLARKTTNIRIPGTGLLLSPRGAGDSRVESRSRRPPEVRRGARGLCWVPARFLAVVMVRVPALARGVDVPCLCVLGLRADCSA